MRATLRKWGSSLGLQIPRALAENAGLTDGSLVELRVENGRLIAEPVTVQNLEALLSKVTTRNRHREVATDAPRGRAF